MIVDKEPQHIIKHDRTEIVPKTSLGFKESNAIMGDTNKRRAAHYEKERHSENFMEGRPLKTWDHRIIYYSLKWSLGKHLNSLSSAYLLAYLKSLTRKEEVLYKMAGMETLLRKNKEGDVYTRFQNDVKKACLSTGNVNQLGAASHPLNNE